MSLSAEYTGKLRNMSSVYLLREDKILLLFRQGSSIVRETWIASAGGHFKSNELNDARSCVLRELSEELGLTKEQICDLRLRYVTLRKTDGEIRQNYYFFAKLNDDVPDDIPSCEGVTQWFPVKSTTHLKMPFTARYVVDHYASIGQYDQHLYGGVGNDKGVTFIEL